MINQNKAATLANVSKDRLKAKLHKDEIDSLAVDYEYNVKIDPSVLDETVKSEVQAVLLRITEKKMIAEAKVE